jgi:hypothetical protein
MGKFKNLSFWTTLSLVVLMFADVMDLDSILSNQSNSLACHDMVSILENYPIPPSLPSDPEYVGVECCLMSVAGCLIARELTKKDNILSDSVSLITKPKFSIGISYSPGIAYAGDLSYPFFSPFPDPGRLFEAIASELYLNNRVELTMGYFVYPKWCLDISGGYMWVRLDGRNPWFFPKENLGESNYWGTWEEHCYWKISTFSGAIGFSYHLDNTKNRFIGVGLEYNSTSGFAHGEYTRALQYPTWELLEGDALRWGRGFGLFLNIGFARQMTKNILFNVSLIIRYSLSKEYKWSLPTWAVLDKPINYSFTGMYLKIGFSYILLNHKTKKEEQ